MIGANRVLALLVGGVLSLAPVFAQSAAPALDPELRALTATLLSLRAGAEEETRGASAELTAAKHQLRDIIDAYMGRHSFPVISRDDFVKEIKEKLGRVNEELKTAPIACRDKGGDCAEFGDPSRLGVADVKATEAGRVFIVTTSFGILCGQDDSIYGYGWDGTSWKRAFEYEAIDYSKGRYAPQTVEGVKISPASDRIGDHYLVVTTGVGSWCTSLWLGVHYQLHRVDVSAHRAERLLEAHEPAYVGDMALLGELSPSEVEFRFTTNDLDGDKLFREAIRRYRIARDGVRRVQPVAAGPADFTEEWMLAPWSDSTSWSEPSKRDALHRWHGQLAGVTGRKFYVESLGSTHRCGNGSPLRQVGFTFEERVGGKRRDVYFLVRQDTPFHFTMVDVGPRPWRHCAMPEE